MSRRATRNSSCRLFTFAALRIVLCALAWDIARGTDPGELREVLLEVDINVPSNGPTLVLVRDDKDELWLGEEDFPKLRLRLPRAVPRVHDQKRYFPLTAINGIAVAVDETTQRALVTVPPQAFQTTRASADDRVSPTLTRAAPGAFLNYQLYGERIDGQGDGGGYAEFGLFGAPGVLTNTAVARSGEDGQRATRLDTTFTRDFPETLQTLNVGDAISDPGSFGNSVRFGGVKLSRNFQLRPDLLTMPTLTAGAMATVPSIVDVFINNQLVSSKSVPPGPFIVDRLPVISGSGAVSVVVRDMLGREQVVTGSFYASTRLLAPGLSQYAFEAGRLREDYGFASDQYGPFMGQGTYRRGLTDSLTLEGHAEYLANDARAGGLAAAVAVGRLGVVSLTAASGGDSAGNGWLGGVGFEHQGRIFSFVMTTSHATDGFRQIGDAATPASRYRERTLVQTGLSLGRAGSIELAYARQTYQLEPPQQTATLSHNIRIGGSATLTLSVTRVSGPGGSTGGLVVFTLPLEGRRMASATGVMGSESATGQSNVIGTLMQSPPVGTGTGYRLSASSTGDYDADWTQHFTASELEVEAARNGGSSGERAYLSGAATFLDGELDTSRSVLGSFAIVDVGGIGGVPVYVDNQQVATTDESGRALVHNLRPYEANRIGIDPLDLPLDTSLAARQIVIAPPDRSGVVARFPVERVRAGSFHLVRESGEPVPAGASVDFNGGHFPVLLDGFVYVTTFDHGLSAEATWNGGRCHFRIRPPPPDDPMPDMGTIVCHETPSLTITRSGNNLEAQ